MTTIQHGITKLSYVFIIVISFMTSSCGGGERRLNPIERSSFTIGNEVITVSLLSEKDPGMIDITAAQTTQLITILPDVISIRDNHRRAAEEFFAKKCGGKGRFEIIVSTTEDLVTLFRGRCKT